MKKNRGLSPDAADLRRRAEAFLREQETRIDRPTTAEETQRLVHELRVHQIELELQNEELRETRARLEQSLERYTDLYDFAPMGYFTLTGDGTIQELNLAGAALLGQDRSRLIGRRFGLFVSAETRPAFNAFLGRALAASSEESGEITIDRGEGAPHRTAHLTGTSMGVGADRRCRIVAMDITERRRDEAALQAALEEKTALLKEVHHRVKNNLQIVTSLLSLQASQVQNPAALAALKDTQSRVRSMALLHESLYRQGGLGQVEGDAYLTHLCAHLSGSFGSVAGRVRLHHDLAPVALGLDQAVPCGLIVNELVSNAFKHAFPGERGGEIRVELRAEPDGRLALVVADDGVGLPPGLDWRRGDTLGLQLVAGLAQQLGAHVETETAAGTRFSLRFVSGR